jgi:glucokinase
MKEPISIGVDIGGSHIAAAAVSTQQYQIISETLTDLTVDSKGAARDILFTWSTCINEVIHRSREQGQIQGIGIAMPGAFNYRKGIALFEDTDKYNALYELDINNTLRPLLDHPFKELRFINDASAFALGSTEEYSNNAEQTKLAVVLGTGFGSALTKANLPLIAGDHVPEHGCFWHLPFRDGIADDYFSTRWFISEYDRLSGNRVGGVKEIADVFGVNDHAQSVFQTFGQNLGQFLTDWIKKLEIKQIVFGGKISKALKLFRPAFEAQLRAQNINLKIHQNQQLDEATILGAARLTDEAFWNQVKDQLPIK